MTTQESNDIERLRDSIDIAWEEARKFGLDPFPTHFELVPASIMYEFASYSLPGRFSHWTHGKAYHRQKMQYDFGLSKIYEMVVNTNPSYAFLMEMNNLLQNTFVVAHVFGHTDFFKNNAYFQHTSRRMIDKVSIHAERIAKYEFDHGKAEVERFLDAALSIQEHVDYNLLLRSDEPEASGEKRTKPSTEYDDLWGLEERQQKAEEERERTSTKPIRFPEKPEKDLLLFLMRYSPQLQPWQRDIIEIVHTEMLYFVPQMQTKVMNEGWACLTGDSLVLTEHGLLRYDALHQDLSKGSSISVASGSGRKDPITDRHIRRSAPTVRLRTRRGLVLEGAEQHKLSLGPDQWIALEDVQVGQRIPLSVGENIWPRQPVSIAPPNRLVSAILVGAPQEADFGVKAAYRSVSEHLLAPATVTGSLAAFIGFILHNGTLQGDKHAICYTTHDRALANRYVQLIAELFSIFPSLTWDSETNHWRVVFYSANVFSLLQSLDIDLTVPQAQRLIPDTILRSPKAVVRAFLNSYVSCTPLETEGLLIAMPSDKVAQVLQILLLNSGILSSRSGSELSIKGRSAYLYAQDFDFFATSGIESFQSYLDNQEYSGEEPVDEVISVEHSVADVYDITVDHSHQYIANGMLHHNSIWHSRIMRELGERGVISDSETVEFAQLHSGVLSPSRTSLNPYYIGFKMLEDIERRWDNPTREEQDRLGRKPGMGRQKIFEVREMDNDVSFLRNYLTEDLIKDLDLYLYKKEGDEWVIVEKNWQKVRDGIVNSMTNFGYPYLVVDNGDYRGNRELYLKHLYEGQELDLNYAEKTLQHVHLLWSRPVHLETVYEGKRILLSYDGERSTKTTLEK